MQAYNPVQVLPLYGELFLPRPPATVVAALLKKLLPHAGIAFPAPHAALSYIILSAIKCYLFPAWQ